MSCYFLFRSQVSIGTFKSFHLGQAGLLSGLWLWCVFNKNLFVWFGTWKRESSIFILGCFLCKTKSWVAVSPAFDFYFVAKREEKIIFLQPSYWRALRLFSKKNLLTIWFSFFCSETQRSTFRWRQIHFFPFLFVYVSFRFGFCQRNSTFHFMERGKKYGCTCVSFILCCQTEWYH